MQQEKEAAAPQGNAKRPVREDLSAQKEKLMKHRIKHQRSYKHEEYQDRYELQKIDSAFADEAKIEA